MDLRKIKNVHFTGIKGVGMTSLALYLQDMGKQITGSDVSEVFVTDEVLRKRDIKWLIGIKKENVPKNIDLLITTAAHGGMGNEEVKYAMGKKIKVITYAEALAEVAKEKETVCVCGVGGKTSISSMLAVLLDSANLDPSYIVGVGNIYPLGRSGRYEVDGRNIICEADDYVVSPGYDNRAKFLLLNPKIIIATNIEYDHPDVYENFEKTKEVFLQFFNKLPKYGYLIINSDNRNTLEIALRSKKNMISYGCGKMADYRIENIRYSEQKTIFNIYIKRYKKVIEDLEINVPGKFNVENAVAAYVAGDQLGIDQAGLKDGLKRYLGCRRRFEDMGYFYGAKFYDDYAHHPGEIKATLKAARDWFKSKRIVVIFQPHTFSRTKALFKGFSESFEDADIVAIMDIYSSAREKVDPLIDSKKLVKEIEKSKKEVFYAKDQSSTVDWIHKNIKSGDIVLTMGAGNIFHLYEKLKNYKSKN